MNYFLIDYENVRVSGFDGVTNLTSEDVVVVFYSENADTLTFGLHRRINESKAQFHFQKVSVGGKNALDFQLCSYLGYLIRDTKNGDGEANDNYYIVSNDHGYIILSDYWKKRGTDVIVVSNLSKKLVEKSEPKEKVATAPIQTNSNVDEKVAVAETENLLKSILSDKNSIAEVNKIINHYKTKNGVYQGLIKLFKQEKGLKIYQAIKSLINDKKGN